MKDQLYWPLRDITRRTEILRHLDVAGDDRLPRNRESLLRQYGSDIQRSIDVLAALLATLEGSPPDDGADGGGT